MSFYNVIARALARGNLVTIKRQQVAQKTKKLIKVVTKINRRNNPRNIGE